MIKKLFPILIILLLIVVIVVVFLSRAHEQQMLTVYEGNVALQPLPIHLHHYQDTQCGMPIESLEDSCQVAAPDGRTWFFDDVGCMVLWIQDKPFIDDAKIWVHSKESNGWIDARSAWYSRTDTTPMNYGFGAYETPEEGRIDFETMQRKMLRGENLTDPYIRKELLGNR
jgi:copper chaperone NosL